MIVRTEEGRTKNTFSRQTREELFIGCTGEMKKYIVLSMTTMLLVWVIRKQLFQFKKQKIDGKMLSL